MFLAIEEDHWIRLLKYSSRIKELHLDRRKDDTDDSLCDCILPLFLAKSGGITSLFPRLQRLRPLFLHPQNGLYMCFLLCPELQSFAVSLNVFKDSTGGANEQLFSMTLGTLSCIARDLQEFILLDDSFASFNMREVNIRCLSLFPHLQRFVSQASLEPAVWANIGVLRRLKYLDINMDHHSSGATPTGDAHSVELLELKSLTLRGSPINFSGFLGGIKAPTLRSATFLVESDRSLPTPRATLEILLHLIKPALPETLINFTLTCQLVYNIQPFVDLFHIDLWGPLSFFSNLKEISIDFSNSPILVSDTEITTLSGALPRLRSLTLQYAYGYSYPMPTRPTIKALVALATRCPDLAHLHLVDLDLDTLIMRAMPAEGTEAVTELEVPVLLCRLHILEIDSFRAVGCLNVKNFVLQLNRLFPEVVTVRPWNGRKLWDDRMSDSVSLDSGSKSPARKCANELLDIVKCAWRNDKDRGIVLNEFTRRSRH